MKLTALKYKNLRPWLWRWHRRVGLTAALLLIITTLTGLLLNHSSELSLAKITVKQAGLLAFYGIETPTLTGYHLQDQWLSGDDKGQLFLDSKHIGQCTNTLVAASLYREMLWVACDQELLLFNQQGDMLDRITAAYGLPVPVKKIGICKLQLCISTEIRQFSVDAEQLVFLPIESVGASWNQKAQLPEHIKGEIVQEHIGEGLSWERVLLDIHSGRLFGFVGVLLVDIAAVFLLFLALSGFLLWYQQKVKKKFR